MADIEALERHLYRLSTLAEQGNSQTWSEIESISRALANELRTKGGPVDRHALLGQTVLPQTIRMLLSNALQIDSIPFESKGDAALELIRVAANFCIDSNENRAHLLEAGLVQQELTILEGYLDKISFNADQLIPLSILELKTIRTIIGALLNASLGFDPVKKRLNSLDAGTTILKLTNRVYPIGAWARVFRDTHGDAEEEWELRSTISNWGWRLLMELRHIKDDVVQIFDHNVFPLLTPPLSAFIPPYPSEINMPLSVDNPLCAALIEADFTVFEESCTLIESLTLDVEDIRLTLARGFKDPTEHNGIPCLSHILDFIERGDCPPTWRNPQIFDDATRKRKEKEFGICKAALVKAVVEITGDEKNVDFLWDTADNQKPGGVFAARMVHWIRSYVEETDFLKGKREQGHGMREDLVICASLSLGNLVRRETSATALVSPPYSLASSLASPLFLSPATDVKLKHAIIGFLKNLAQSSSLSKIVLQSLGNAGIVQKLAESGIWDERADVMTDIVQLNAISVVKHLCNASAEHAIALTLAPSHSIIPSGLAQILALVKRSDSVPVKSEGARVLASVIKSLWSVDQQTAAVKEITRQREAAIKQVITQESADILANLLGRSGRFPALINESLVALTLLSTVKEGAPLVVNSLTKPVNSTLPGNASSSTASPSSDVSSPVVTSPVQRTRLHVPRHALDMLRYVLRNVDNPANYPIEVRVNVCSLLLHLGKNAPAEDMAKVKEAVRPTLERVAESLPTPQGNQGKEELLQKAIEKVLAAWA